VLPVTIHSGHPFADPEGARDAARRLRGRLSARVGLWTTGADRDRAGLTVSSMLVVGGATPLVVGMLDPYSALWETLDVGDRVVVHLLEWEHRDLAEQFAGLMPAPGGLFAGATWEQTAAGPRLTSAETWAACTVTDTRLLGWSLEVVCSLDDITLGSDAEPLLHHRGRYLMPTRGT
jgi:flavin reductase (DIM6/NTAB) family NADH-FMN oxidoreductase RutF